MCEIKSWESIRNYKLLLQRHRLIKVSTLFPVPLMTEGARAKGRVRTEAGVVMPTEGVMVTTRGVVTRRQRTRDLPDMAIRVAKEARVTVNHPTSPPSTLTRINRLDTISNIKTKTETRVEMTKGDQAIVGVIIVALGEVSQALPGNVTGVTGLSITYMGSATGKTIVSQNLYAKRVAALM